MMDGMKNTPTTPQVNTPRTLGMTVCALSVDGDGQGASGTVQLLPAGPFRAQDGRPEQLPAWRIDAAIAQRLMRRVASRQNPIPIDYEHQTLYAERNGQPAPAAGWFRTLEWREGQGLFAVGVAWTEQAKRFIKNGEYRYISPVFRSDPRSGAVVDLLNAALTNTPAIDGMEAVMARAEAYFSPMKEEKAVDLTELITLLGLPPEAGLAEIIEAVKALMKPVEPEAARLGRADPAHYVPIAVVESLKQEVAVLRSGQQGQDVAALVAAGLRNGKLVPAQEGWARELGSKDVAALRAYLDKTPTIAALSGLQSGGKAAHAMGVSALSDSARAVCRAMGLAPEQFIAARQAEEV